MNIIYYICLSIKRKKMSVKGTVTTSDYIEFDRATAIGEKLLKDEKLKTLGLYIIVSINSGLRISDVLSLKGENLKTDTIKLVEKKTNKHREIKINDNIKKAVNQFHQLNDGYLFISQKKTVYSIQSINRLLKVIFKNLLQLNLGIMTGILFLFPKNYHLYFFIGYTPIFRNPTRGIE